MNHVLVLDVIFERQCTWCVWQINKKIQFLTNEIHNWLATKFFMNQEVLCKNPKILVNNCKQECYNWIKNAIMIRILTKLVGFEEIGLKALKFVRICVFERVMLFESFC